MSEFKLLYIEDDIEVLENVTFLLSKYLYSKRWKRGYC